MSRPRTLALVALLAATLVGPAAWASPAEADAHFKHGVELFKDNDYAAALVEFKRAYELDPKYQVLYNIGESQFQLQDYASALRTFQQYLNEGGPKITAGRRADVEKDLDKLKKRVARLEVLTKEPGAAIAVDDVQFGKTPLDEALLLSAGHRKVTATLPGRPPATQLVDLAGGDTRSITIEIPTATRERVEVMVPVTAAPPVSTFPIWPWVATGALATGALVTGILALSASSDLTDKLGAFPGDPSAISSARSKTAALAATTDILIGSTAVAAGISVYLTLRKPKPAPALVGLTPRAPGASTSVVFTPGSVGLAGSF
ncbi:MAG TPA: tetratricopeptide repeat protein [Byssovorax sp.]